VLSENGVVRAISARASARPRRSPPGSR
jgi:hypothetical protein